MRSSDHSCRGIHEGAIVGNNVGGSELVGDELVGIEVVGGMLGVGVVGEIVGDIVHIILIRSLAFSQSGRFM